jgi:hypothetical protein
MEYRRCVLSADSPLSQLSAKAILFTVARWVKFWGFYLQVMTGHNESDETAYIYYWNIMKTGC